MAHLLLVVVLINRIMAAWETVICRYVTLCISMCQLVSLGQNMRRRGYEDNSILHIGVNFEELSFF